MDTKNIQRRYDVDWLRILGVLLLVPFHALLIFVQDPNSVVFLKDTVDCIYCDRVAGFIDQFHMPLLFIIAGMSTAFSLAKRSGGQYLRERVSRLVIPLVFGLAIIVPPMTYITQIVQGKTLTYWQHYANFFTLGSDMNGIQGTFNDIVDKVIRFLQLLLSELPVGYISHDNITGILLFPLIAEGEAQINAAS